jgi:hypothetical protein
LVGAGVLNPNSEVEDDLEGIKLGAYASGVWFSASRRKQCPHFLQPQPDKEVVLTRVRAGRPDSHARGVRSPIQLRSSG